jgi:hypothetical protein
MKSLDCPRADLRLFPTIRLPARPPMPFSIRPSASRDLAGCGKLSLCTMSRWNLPYWRRCQQNIRMLKKAAVLTHPTPARRDALFRRQGRSL